MVRKRTIGLAAVVLVGGLALARATRTDSTNAPSESHMDRAREAITSQSDEHITGLREALPDRSSDGLDSTDTAGLLSSYTLRAGIYLDHVTDDSTLALEWRRD